MKQSSLVSLLGVGATLIIAVWLSAVIPNYSSSVVSAAFALGLFVTFLIGGFRHFRREAAFILPLIGILFLMIVYLANASHRWEPGVGLLPMTHWSLLPATVHRPVTLSATAIFGIAIMFVWLGARIASSKHLRWLLSAMVLSGTIMAIWVLHQRLTPNSFNIFPLTGAFPYENHYAAYINLLIPVALALGKRCQYLGYQSGQLSSPAPVYYLAAVIMGSSMFFSGSRMGVLMTGLLLVSWFVYSNELENRYADLKPRRWNPPRKAVLGVCAIALLIGMGVGLRHGWGQLDRLQEELSFRSFMIKDTLSMWQDRKLWGVGPGAFGTAFPYYQSATPADVQVTHTHNEPSQLLAEWGWAGILWLTLCVALCLRYLRRYHAEIGHSSREEWPLFREIEGVGLCMGITSVAIHAFVDFPFRQPAILWTVVVFAVLVIRHWDSAPEQSSREKV